MKKICTLITGVIIGLSGYSQTIPKYVEKQIQDPQRRANAGKADAIISKKKNIFDSTTFNNNTTEASNNKTAKASIRKKYCGNKTKQSSKSGASRKSA
ncbi:hypothetical protein [Segetibacter sp.]|jgi:hypothetical protein|uniref:hypothetical protein n=1 Tax=Segetibacter sp. TaxID=2231182 RepID=UPI00262F8729|nr:hypothetical protein [Segetibacter sp.]MCW3082550.1 hypothetical protein [Segetibacter sp.]